MATHSSVLAWRIPGMGEHDGPPSMGSHRLGWTRLKRLSMLLLLLKSLQSCPTLCDPIDSNPPGSLVPGIPQARTLEWVAIS